jgi:hypothetical protein
METKQHNILVITIAAMISAVVCFATVKYKNANHFDSRVFKVVNGWGYDILVNNELFIHQESIPVWKNNQPFSNKEEAEQSAKLVIHKLKKGEPPGLTKFDLEKIIRVHDSETSK